MIHKTLAKTISFQTLRIGLLLHSVCLLTTSGKEEGMLDDFAGAYERLRVTIRLVPGIEFKPMAMSTGETVLRFCGVRGLEHDSGSSPPDASAKADLGCVVVTLCIQAESDFEWLVRTARKAGLSADSLDIQVIPVLFNLGVNEMQTIANQVGSTEIQTSINLCGVVALRKYHQAFAHFRCSAEASEREETGAERGADERKVGVEQLPLLLDTLDRLVHTEASERRKLVDLPLVSCLVARTMNASCTISCKSAKDRTSMFQTLEFVRTAENNRLLER